MNNIISREKLSRKYSPYKHPLITRRRWYAVSKSSLVTLVSSCCFCTCSTNVLSPTSFNDLTSFSTLPNHIVNGSYFSFHRSSNSFLCFSSKSYNCSSSLQQDIIERSNENLFVQWFHILLYKAKRAELPTKHKLLFMLLIVYWE